LTFLGQNYAVPISKSIQEFLSSLSEHENSLYPYMANIGKPFDATKDTVYYSGPYWTTEEVEVAIESLLVGKWLSSGEKVNQFERAFSKYFNSSNSVMVNSGSSANLVMIAALKDYFSWTDGDEIVVSVVGFPTTANSVLQNGLVPKFVDISWGDLNWDVEKVRESISERTKALFFSPVLGNPGKFNEILEIVETYNLKLILDNCDSLGSKWNGKYLNEYAVASSCSFYPAHHITTMEGGMVSSSTEEIITLARSYAWWGRGCYCVGRQNLLPNGTCKKRFDTWIPNCSTIVDHKYVFDKIGYNLKPLDLQGAIGLVQLKKFEDIHTLRRRNKSAVDSYFSSVPGCTVIEEIANSEVSWFGAPVVCESEDLKRELVSFLEGNRIQTRNYFAGNLLMQPGYTHLGDWRNFPNASRVLEQVFFVGVSPTINVQMLSRIEEVVTNFLAVHQD
jgi:CDP-4-dehydro-6-deoxyglucose reductase, E1